MAKLARGGKFFAATVFQGRLHIWGVPAWGSWDSARFVYIDESALALRLVGSPEERKTKSPADLECEVAKSRDPHDRPRTLWIHEDLQIEAQRFWFNLMTV